MPYEIGEADNYVDLMDKLRLFAVGIGWIEKRWNNDGVNAELILCGPGLSNKDEIYIGTKSIIDTNIGFYNWQLNGYLSYNATATWDKQPGAISSQVPELVLCNDKMKYWFVGNGRRLVGIIKCINYYESFYLGLLTSYIPPGIYPYPLIIGGSLAPHYSGNHQYGNTTSEHAHWICPGQAYSSNNVDNRPSYHTSCRFRDSTGNWRSACNIQSNGNKSASYVNIYPTLYGASIRHNLDGTIPVFQAVLYDGQPNVYGEFEGCFGVSGVGLSPEDVIIIDGIQYLVVYNVWRSGDSDFWALRLD
ncbi:MAG: hypothetical protein ACI3ZR_05885 [bacterium]